MANVRQSTTIKFLTARSLDGFECLGRETSKITNQHHGLVLVSVGVSESADFQKALTAYRSADYATTLRKFQPLAEQRHAVIAKFLLDGMFDIEYCDPQ
jgi:hypothetical protein